MPSQETKTILVVEKAIRALVEFQISGKVCPKELHDTLSALRWERVRLLKEVNTDEYLTYNAKV